MHTLRNLIKERVSGLLLILLALLISGFFYFDSYVIKAKNRSTVNIDENLEETQEENVLGENIENEYVVSDEDKSNQDIKNPIETNIDTENNDIQGLKKEQILEEKNNEDNVDIYYINLKAYLKKYCDKSFDAKKCREYLLKTKNKSKNDSRFKVLYRKYHFEKKENEKEDEKKADSEADRKVEEKKYGLSVASNESTKFYEVAIDPKNSVIDLMDLLQSGGNNDFSYHSLSGFVDKINNISNQGDMSWMLYVCKSSICKLSSVGASDCKIADWNKIEWRYLDWTTVDWTTW